MIASEKSYYDVVVVSSEPAGRRFSSHNQRSNLKVQALFNGLSSPASTPFIDNNNNALVFGKKAYC
jgi:hypothetical protein